MDNQETLQKLIDAIVARVPECGYGCENCKKWWTVDSEMKCPMCQRIVQGGDPVNCCKTGRAITLEDVLRALKDHDGLRFDVRGIFFSEPWTIACCWTLGKPLSEQSPETISFLHSLLCER